MNAAKIGEMWYYGKGIFWIPAFEPWFGFGGKVYPEVTKDSVQIQFVDLAFIEADDYGELRIFES